MRKIKEQPYSSCSRNTRNIIIKNDFASPSYSNIRQKYPCLSVEIFDASFGRVKPVKLKKINVYSARNMAIFKFRKRSGIDYNNLIPGLSDPIE
jgi:hypothetical protein